MTFWENCYGLDLGLLGEQKLAGMAGKPLVEDVAQEDLLSAPAVLCDLDLHSVTAQDLAVVERAFSFSCAKPDARLAGLALWFDCVFAARDADATHTEAAALGKRARDADTAADVVVLSTAPGPLASNARFLAAMPQRTLLYQRYRLRYRRRTGWY